MKDKEILKQINRSINHLPIDILENIKNAEVVKMTEHDEITRQEFSTKASKSKIFTFNNHKTFISLASFAAVFMIVFIGFYQVRIPDSQIYLDINPSIQITTNKRDKVIDLTALNEDSISIIDDIDYKNKKLEDITEAIIKSLAIESIVNSSYIGDEQSVLLVSVYNKNSNKGDEQAEKLDKLVREKIDSYNLHPVILTQSIGKSNTLDEFAKEYGISVGKMTFIRNLIILDPDLKTEDLVNLSLYELLEISINTGIDIDIIVNSGNDERVHKVIPSETITEIPTTPPSEEEEESETNETTSTATEPTISSPTTKATESPKASTEPTTKVTESPKPSTSPSPISADKAKHIALSKVGGGTVVEFELDDDEYEVKIHHNGYEYDIEINAYTGAIIDFDKDEIDD